MAKLIFTNIGKLHEIALGEEASVGRGESATIRVEHGKLSRLHFRVFRRNDGYAIEDLGSSNGTSLNGRRIGRDAQILADKDNVLAGGISFTFLAEAPALVPKTSGSARAAKIQAPWLLYHPPNQRPEERLELDAPLSIGRRAPSTLIVDEKKVSGKHCRIERRQDAWWIIDEASANGTFVNDRRVHEQALRHGDVIRVASVATLDFHDPSAAKAAPATQTAPAMRESSPIFDQDDEPAGTPADTINEEALVAPDADHHHVAKPDPQRAWSMGLIGPVLIGLGLLALGWFLPGAFVLPEAEVAAVPLPIEIPALSFEGAGSLGGWEMSAVHNGRLSAGLSSLPQEAYDGTRALLVMYTPEDKLLSDFCVFATSKELDLNLTGPARMSLWVMGLGPRCELRVLAIEASGQSLVLGASQLLPATQEGWREVQIRLDPFRAITKARLALELSGTFRLRLDRLSIGMKSKVAASEVPAFVLGELGCEIMDGGRLQVREGEAKVCECAARAVDKVGRELSWVYQGAQGEDRKPSLVWKSSRHGTQALMSMATALAPPTFEGGASGLECTIRVQQAAEWGLQVELQAADEVVLYDRKGAVIIASEVPGAALAPVYGVDYGRLGLVFADGAAVRLEADAEQGGLRRMYVYGKQPGQPLTLRLYGQAVNAWRIHAEVIEEMNQLLERGRKSAALERARWLAGRDPRRFAEHAQLGARCAATLEQTLDAWWALAERQRAAAFRDADASAHAEARMLFERMLAEYPGDKRRERALAALEELKTRPAGRSTEPAGARESYRGHPPEAPASEGERALAEQRAQEMLALANEEHAKGNLMRAWLLVDNLRFNLAFTSSAPAAEALVKAIEAVWNDAATREAWIKDKMREAEQASDSANPGRALDLYREIMARYPRAPQASELRRRIAALEGQAR